MTLWATVSILAGTGSEISIALGIESQISQIGQISTRAWSAEGPEHISSAQAPWADRRIGAQNITNAKPPVHRLRSEVGGIGPKARALPCHTAITTHSSRIPQVLAMTGKARKRIGKNRRSACEEAEPAPLLRHLPPRELHQSQNLVWMRCVFARRVWGVPGWLD